MFGYTGHRQRLWRSCQAGGVNSRQRALLSTPRSPAGDRSNGVGAWFWRYFNASGTRSRSATTAVVSLLVVSVGYLAFVTHFSRNALFEDDWSVVPLVHAALHGHLTFTALWAQHHQDRMLLPNVIFVALGTLTHLDTRVIILFSALLFVITFFIV